MPIAAGSYPYPGAPSAPTGEIIRPVVPEDYQRIEARPEMFGEQVGHSMSALGGVLAKSADEFARLTLERQDLHNKVTSDAQTNNYLDATNKILYGDPNDPTKPGYYALRGEAAVRAFPATRDALMQAREQMRGALENDYQRMQFDAETRRQQSYLLGQVGRHYDVQYDAHQTATSDAKYALGKGSAAANVDDPNGFALGVQQMMTAAIDKVKQNGGGQEQIDVALAKVRADATVMRIDGLTPKTPAAAMNLLNDPENKALILAQSPTEYLRLERSIKSSLVQQGAREITANVMTPGGPLGPPPSGPVNPAQFTDEANKQGVDPRLVHATASIESDYGKNTDNKISPSNTGIFQRAPADKPGGKNDSYENQIRLGVGDLAKERDGLRDSLGREPTNAEVYLAHQQGVSGATKLIQNPNTPAGQLVPPVNIRNNGGNPDAPASQFVAHWQTVYANHEQRFQGITPTAGPPAPGAAPAAPALPNLAQLEADASARVDAYATQNGLDDDLTEELRARTLSGVRAQFNTSAAAIRQTEQANRTIAQAQVLAGNNGEPFHDLNAYLADPDRRALYDQLKPNDQIALRKQIEDAATHVPLTPERMQRYDELHGISVADPASFMQVDILKEDLPIGMKKQLIAMRDQIAKGAARPFDALKAYTVIRGLGLLDDTGIDPKNNPPLYHQFMGALYDAGNQYKEIHKQAPDTEALRGIASDLLKVVIPKSWWFGTDTHAFETMVPTSERNDIVKAYQTQFGRTPTPSKIMEIYHYQLEHRTGPNQAAAELPEPEGVSVP